MYGVMDEWRDLTVFSAALSSGLLPGVSASTVSRWETGASAVSFEAVRGYESLLRLPPYSLVAVLDTVFRYYGPTGATAPRLARSRSDARTASRVIHETLLRAVGGDVLGGAEWDRLSALTVAHPPVVRDTRAVWWSEATRRLLIETMISSGVSWMLRFEAMNRLLAHPLVGPEAVAAVRDILEDGGTQSLVGTACMFDASASSDASALVMRYLAGTDDDRVFKGALMACVRKIKFGHFHGPELASISRIASDAADCGVMRLNDETQALAVSVLRQIPPTFQSRHGLRVLRTLKARCSQAALVDENRLLPAEPATLVARRIADHAASRAAVAGEEFVDPVLPLLVEEALFDPVFDVRLYASSLIHATPYREWVAQALAVELAMARRNQNAVMLTTLFEALRKLGGPRERVVIEGVVLDPGSTPAAADTAAYALGHIGGASTERFWRRALSQHRAAWIHSANTVSASVLDRLVYAIGMADASSGLLCELCADDRIPPKVKESARWWQGHSAALVASRHTI